MRITQEADYAIRITCLLAEKKASAEKKGEGAPITGAQDISDQTYVPHRFTLSILRRLVMSGIVRSYKGKSGGYTLARDEGDISLRDIIEAIDGPVYINKCLDSEHVCSRQGIDKSGCRIHCIFTHLSHQVAEKLGRVTVKDAIDQTVSVDTLFKLID